MKKETNEIMATWDDHDFGKNDGGEKFPYKKESKKMPYYKLLLNQLIFHKKIVVLRKPLQQRPSIESNKIEKI